MCTNFRINIEGGGVIVGRSQEFAHLLSHSLVFRAKGYKYKQNLMDPNQPECKPTKWAKETFKFKWEGKYGFVAMNALDLDNPNIADKAKLRRPMATDGINTEGLYVGALLQNAAQYPEVQDPKKGLAVTNFVDWLLSSCKDCNDVKNKLSGKNPVVEVSSACVGSIQFNLHYPIHDKHGNSIVVEFIKGKVHIHNNNKYGVLTNDPEFNWHQKNMQQYVDISPWSVNQSEPGQLAETEIKNLGNGFTSCPGGQLPSHRFIRAAMMVNYSQPVKNAEQGVTLASHVLNTLDIPKGVVREQNDDGSVDVDYTQYVTISDLEAKKFYVRLYDSALLYTVDLNKLNLKKLNGKLFPIPTKKVAINLTKQVVELE